MKISRDNFEAYFLDYHEGRLSPEMVEAVMLFVEQNPDLKNILSDFESVSLETDNEVVFENKSFLKKDQVFATSLINEMNYEEFLIGECEGVLTREQLDSLEEFISINPQFEKDRKLFSLAYLPAENDIVFGNKELLKKTAIPVGHITIDTYETFLAREIEEDLNQEEQQQLAEFMQYNPQFEKDRKLYSHTILSAESDVVFDAKESLKRNQTPVRQLVYYALAVAASLTLILSLYFLINSKELSNNPARLANNERSTLQNSAVPVNKDNSLVKKNIPETESDKVSFSDQHNQIHPLTTKEKHLAGNDPVNQLANAERTNIDFLQIKQVSGVQTKHFVDPQFTFIRTSQMYINEHIEFYYNLKLGEQLQYAEVNTKDNHPAKTIMNAATGKAEDLFAANHDTPSREERKNLSLWTFAELGVQTFNTVTSSEIELKLRKDEEGKVISYGIEGGLLDFEKQVKK